MNNERFDQNSQKKKKRKTGDFINANNKYPDRQRAQAEAISIFAYRTKSYRVKMQLYDSVEVLAMQIYTITAPAMVLMIINHTKVNIYVPQNVYDLLTIC